jgi:hypothetical protein
MAEPTTPEYDQFADQARREMAAAEATVAQYQAQARRLLEQGEGDVTAGAPDGG